MKDYYWIINNTTGCKRKCYIKNKNKKLPNTVGSNLPSWDDANECASNYSVSTSNKTTCSQLGNKCCDYSNPSTHMECKTLLKSGKFFTGDHKDNPVYIQCQPKMVEDWDCGDSKCSCSNYGYCKISQTQ